MTLPTGVPLTISFTLTLAAMEGSTLENSGSWDLDFSDTASFALEGPVFDLPIGYTVNRMGIVNNAYTVPEPGTVLSALGAGWLMISRRRHSGRCV